METTVSHERVKWIDTAKFIGIVLIFFGHVANPSFYMSSFAGEFDVPLFFFLSGCVEHDSLNGRIGDYFRKSVKTILLPYLFFCGLSILFEAVNRNLNGHAIFDWIAVVAKGTVREWFMAYQLWFLSALFIMKLVFRLLCYLKKKFLIFVVCVVLSVIAYGVRDTGLSHLPWNLYWVAYYIIFYTIGYCIYPYIAKWFALDSLIKKTAFAVSLFASAMYAYLVVFRGYEMALGGTIIARAVTYIIRSMIVMWTALCLARLLQDVQLFQRLGKETIWLCGNEYIAERGLVLAAGYFGINLSQDLPIMACFSSVIALFAIDKFLMPIEKEIYVSIGNVFKKIDSKSV